MKKCKCGLMHKAGHPHLKISGDEAVKLAKKKVMKKHKGLPKGIPSSDKGTRFNVLNSAIVKARSSKESLTKGGFGEVKNASKKFKKNR
jgi:hypothetical protein